MTVTTTIDDAAALLRSAQQRVHHWPAEFSGFRADLEVGGPEGAAHGTVEIGADGKVRAQLEGSAELATWARQQLAGSVAHRWHQEFEEGDGASDIALADDGSDPLGRLVSVSDSFASTYRLRDGLITEIVRSIDGGTIRVFTSGRTEAPDGGLLPTTVATTHLADDGALTVSVVQESWAVVDGQPLQASRQVVRQRGDEVTTRRLVLSGHTLGGAA